MFTHFCWAFFSLNLLIQFWFMFTFLCSCVRLKNLFDKCPVNRFEVIRMILLLLLLLQIKRLFCSCARSLSPYYYDTILTSIRPKVFVFLRSSDFMSFFDRCYWPFDYVSSIRFNSIFIFHLCRSLSLFLSFFPSVPLNSLLHGLSFRPGIY